MKDWFQNNSENRYKSDDGQGNEDSQDEWLHNKKEKKSWHSYMTKDNMIILVLLGVLLFIMALPTKKETNIAYPVEEDQEVEAKNLVETKQESEIWSYTQLEKRLEDTLSYVHGVGKVKVMITLQSSEELVLEKDSPSVRSNTSENDKDGGNRTVSEMEVGEETVYITDREGNKEPVITKTMEPDIEGVVVIAEGGSSIQVQTDITQIIQSLFDVEVNKIKVVKMK